MKITFYGAAGAVTGSNYLLESGGHKIMIDCGLHQGSHFADTQNFEPFGYDASGIEAVLVTHAHLDHVGRIPKLVGEGFKGTIYSTPPTKDFAELVLLDSVQILGREAEREQKEEICTTENVQKTMEQWETVNYHQPFVVGPFSIKFFDAGHILGSSFIRIEAEGKSIIFSGDLGNSPAPIIRPLENMVEADYCVIDSTYGSRLHQDLDQRRNEFEDVIEDTVKAGGVLMIPAFALERTQELLYHLHQLFEQGRVPRVPVFIDSPLAIKMTAVYKKYENFFNNETHGLVKSGDDILNFPGLHLTLSTEQSKEINEVHPPKIIIAGSGMSNGGRILHHEMRYLGDSRSTILFVGYQARGTIGRQILEGAKTVRIFGEEVHVRCKQRNISSYSAHADQAGLLHWLMPMRTTLKKVFATHGEPEESSALVQKIRDDLAIEALAPQQGESFEL